jgi:hypothetical protein
VELGVRDQTGNGIWPARCAAGLLFVLERGFNSRQPFSHGFVEGRPLLGGNQVRRRSAKVHVQESSGVNYVEEVRAGTMISHFVLWPGI